MSFRSFKESVRQKYFSTPRDEDGLQFWREKIFYFFSLALVGFGLISYVASVIICLRLDLWGVIIVDNIVYATILLIHFNKSWSFNLRVNLLLTVIYFLGITILMLIGSGGDGMFYLLCVPIIASFLKGFKPTVVIITINTATIIALGFLLYYGFLDKTAMLSYSIEAWIVVGVNFIAVNFMASIPIAVLIEGLRFSVEQERKSRELLSEAQLQMLQQQLNPHFLFNTLNSLRSLIQTDRQRARGMVTDLSEFLRVTLSSYKSLKNTVQDELAMVEYYLKIQEIRFDKELNYAFFIEDEILNFSIPKFILQPIVENAIKYGMLTSPMPLRLVVDGKRSSNKISIRVLNSGTLVDCSKEEHANNGLENTIKRLDLMFPRKAKLRLFEQAGMVVVEMVIEMD